jgi:hypothetical protein
MAVKLQHWGDDLRLPSFVDSESVAPLMASIESYRKTSTPFQSKHLPALKRNVWYALQRPSDKSRTGLLVVWPEKGCCVYLSGEPYSSKSKRSTHNRVALLRIRLDPQFLAPDVGITVMAATLSASARRLWIEDVLVWKGRPLTEPFVERWRFAVQWLEHYCILDSRLLSGVEIDLAMWQPLAAVGPHGSWDLISDVAGAQRLWFAPKGPSRHGEVPADKITHVSESYTVPKSIPGAKGAEVTPQATSEATGPAVAVATREPGPDQWALTSSDGVSLGRALIRTMKASSALRAIKQNTVRMEVVWAPSFKKWEIVDISTRPASHSRFFDVV